jgi:hypothetical protein
VGFTIKHTREGKVERYKARLVARGYSQAYGIDYDETFAPVAKMSTIRTLISCAANFGWPLNQLDVKNAFLHGDLQEEVYMDTPGFSKPEMDGKVCRLKKSLCGLNNLHEHGLIDSDVHCVVWGINNAMGTTLYSTDTQGVESQF